MPKIDTRDIAMKARIDDSIARINDVDAVTCSIANIPRSESFTRETDVGCCPRREKLDAATAHCV